MLAIGALGAGRGVWAAFGYLIGLLFFWHDDQGRGVHRPMPTSSTDAGSECEREPHPHQGDA